MFETFRLQNYNFFFNYRTIAYTFFKYQSRRPRYVVIVILAHHPADDALALCDDALSQINTIMSGHRSEHDIRDSYRIENDINQMRQRLKGENIRAVNAREYDYALGTVFADLVNECEKLGDYVVNVVQARFGK